jgi:hypothetical protein
MLPLLQNLHLIAAKRGDGLRPEFLRMQGEAAQSVTFPRVQTQLSTLPGNRVIPAQCISELQSVDHRRLAVQGGVEARRLGTPSR